MKKFHLISLGCAKNLVDSELMLGSMTEGGWQLSPDPEDSDLLIVNTCGFIQPAVEEAISEIFQLVLIKEKSAGTRIAVVGCLVQRYKEQLAEDLPEVDLFVGTEAAADLATIIDKLEDGSLESRVVLPERFLMNSGMARVLSTPPFRSLMKITEGCSNNCSYCMIPAIRGPLRSRPISDLVQEAINLENFGVKELSLIAQDSTAYGNDLSESATLVELLKDLLQGTAIPWFRLLYLYPSGVTDELLQLMADEPRIVPYFDIPFQHVTDRILKRMNRRYSSQDLYDLVVKARSIVPDIALRTTFLVGFPGETEREFSEIEAFLRKNQIDHVGVFPYANEAGSPSEFFQDQLSKEVKQERCDYLLQVQAEISSEIQKKYIDRVEEVLVEGVSVETDLLLEGRTQYQAHDVDGCVYINDGVASPGDIVKVKITDAQIYDLVGSIID